MHPKKMIDKLLSIGFTELEIARGTGLSQPTIWRITNAGQSPRYEAYDAIRRLFNKHFPREAE